MYPSELVAPMKSELEMAGFEQLQTPDQVDKALLQPGTVLCVVNSVCGCAAGAATGAAAVGAAGTLAGAAKTGAAPKADGILKFTPRFFPPSRVSAFSNDL